MTAMGRWQHGRLGRSVGLVSSGHHKIRRMVLRRCSIQVVHGWPLPKISANGWDFEFKLQRLSWPLVQSRHIAESRCVTHRRTLVLISCMHRESRRRWSKSGSLRHYEPDATREFDALVNVTSIGHDRIIPNASSQAFLRKTVGLRKKLS
jgi:hypothetical protein